MGFTDKIITGKTERIEELEALLETNQGNYSELEVAYDHAIMQRDARINEMTQFKTASTDATEKTHAIYKQLKEMEDSRNEEILKNVQMKEEVFLTNKELDYCRLTEMGNLNDHITRLADQITEMEINKEAKKKQKENEILILGEKL